MSEYIEAIEFQLQDPIKVSANIKGENTFIDLEQLYLRAPTSKHRIYSIPLKKKFMEALFGMTKSVNKDEAQSSLDKASSDDEKLDAQAIKTILYASEGFDIMAFYDKFIKFLSADVCFKDEEHKDSIKGLELEKLSEDDLESLISKYIEVFFIVSWMKTLK